MKGKREDAAAPSERWHWITIGYGVALLNWGLFAVLLLQGALAFLIYFEKQIPLPGFVLNDLERKLESIGLYSRMGDFYFDATGRIFARDLKILRRENDALLAQSDDVIIALDLPMLLIKRVRLENIIVDEGHFFCPALYSSSGLEEIILDNIHGNLVRDNKSWKIKGLNFQLHNLRVHVGGALADTAKFLLQPSLSKIEPRPVENYLEFCRTLSGWQRGLSQFSKPVATLHLESGGENHPLLKAIITGAGFRTSEGLLSGPFRIEAPLINIPRLEVLDRIYLQSDALSLGEDFQTGNVKASVRVDSLLSEKLENIKAIRLAALAVASPYFKTDTLFGEIFPGKYPALEGKVILNFANQPFKVEGAVNLQRQTAALSIDSLINPEKTNRLPFLHSLPMRQNFKFGNPPHLRADLQLAEGYALKQVRFSFLAAPFQIRGADFMRFTAEGSMDPSGMQLKSLLFENPDYRATGSFHYDFESGDYRLLLAGHLFPTHLNPALPGWWHKIWVDFSSPPKPFRGDVDIMANWKRKKLHFYFGSVEGEDFAYRGLQFSKMALKSWSVPGFVELFDIKAERAEGWGKGSMQWVYEGKRNTARSLHLDTRFFVSDLSALLGEDVEKVAKDFSLFKPPRLKLNGVLFDLEAPPALRRDLSIEAFSNDPLLYREIPLDRLAFKARLLENKFETDSLSFGLAGGKGSGRLIWKEGDAARGLQIKFHISGAEEAKVMEVLGLSQPIDKKTPRVKENLGKPEKGLGRLDIDFTASGNPNDYFSFDGTGNLHIYDAELGRIYLFGGLSKLLYGTWVDFTTLDIKEAEGRFQLHKNILEFPSLKFSGPNFLLQTSGVMDFPEKNIDFKVRFYYLENNGNPLSFVLRPLFKPVGSAFSVRLRGTFEKPKWRFSIDPRNIFSNNSISHPETEPNPDGGIPSPSPEAP